MKSATAFESDFWRSAEIVNKVAVWLNTMPGMRAFINPIQLRPDEKLKDSYRDRGDIAVLWEQHLWRVEVKWRATVQFTCAADYPYGTIIIDETYHVDRSPADLDPLYAYVLVAKDKDHCAVVYRRSRPEWKIETIYDAAQKRECSNYVISRLGSVSWMRLSEEKREW